jgi:sugar O-acyltransferase (sialic acid O-acetyltransferase NeuD family)
LAKLILFGATDMARLAHFYFTQQGKHQVVAFTVDGEYRRASTYLGLPLVDFESVSEKYPPEEFKMFIAVGYKNMNTIRAAKYEAAKGMGYDLVSYISPHCSYVSQFPPGENCFILENVIVEPFAKIGSDVILWSGSWIAHDTVVEDHCFFSGHVAIAGFCRVGSHSFLGVNVTVRDGLILGHRTLLGAGALVVRDTGPDSVHLSPPAAKLEKTSAISRL